MPRDRLGPSAAAVAALALLLGATACGSSSQAVSSDISLDTLGKRLSTDGTKTFRFLAGTALSTDGKVARDASRDVSCSGGHRREFEASFTAATSVAGEGESDNLNNTESLVTQSVLKPAGYRLTTDVSGKVPATLEFANKPSKPADKRTFVTKVTSSGDRFSWRITGRTACISD